MAPSTGQRCKALLFLHPGEDVAAMEDAAEAMRSAVGDRVGREGWTRLLRRLPDDPLATMWGDDRPTFSAVIEVGAATVEALAAAVAGLADGVGVAVDPARSTVVAGREHVIRSGSAPYQLLFLMRAKPGMTLAQFHEYWRNVHAVHHAHLDGVPGYRQLHADRELSDRLSRLAGFGGGSYDGVAETFVEDVGVFGRGRPDGRGDRENFVDASSELGIIARIVVDEPSP